MDYPVYNCLPLWELGGDWILNCVDSVNKIQLRLQYASRISKSQRGCQEMPGGTQVRCNKICKCSICPFTLKQPAVDGAASPSQTISQSDCYSCPLLPSFASPAADATRLEFALKAARYFSILITRQLRRSILTAILLPLLNNFQKPNVRTSSNSIRCCSKFIFYYNLNSLNALMEAHRNNICFIKTCTTGYTRKLCNYV